MKVITMQYPTVSVNGVSVRIDEEGRYNLNDLHAAAVAEGNATESQRPGEFLKTKQVRLFVQALSDAKKIASVKTIKGGSQQGSWGLELVANRISNAWQAAIARYNPQIRGVSNSLVSSIEGFLTGGNFEKILTEVEGGLDKLGKWLNSEQFKNDLDDFTKKVSAICSAIGRAVTFIYNLVGEEKGEDNNTINKTNNFVGNIGERSGRTVRDWLRGKGFELGWWTFEDERNQANIQEVEQFAQSARRTHKDNSVTEQYRATYSLPRGLRNNNPGNLNFAGQRGATLEDGSNARFARFPSMVEGIAALDRQVMLYLKRDKNTIDKIIDIYAPSSDGNNTSAYKSYLSRYTGLGLNEKINSSNIYTIQKLIQGIINHENGLAAGVISGEDILKAMAMNRGGGGPISNNPASQVVKLEVSQKPGSDILALLAGQMQIPG